MNIKEEELGYFENQGEMTVGEKIRQQTLLHYETYVDLNKDPHTKPLAKHLARLELVQARYIAEKALEHLDELIAKAGN